MSFHHFLVKTDSMGIPSPIARPIPEKKNGAWLVIFGKHKFLIR